MTDFQFKTNIISIFIICEIENQTSEENKGDVVWAALPKLNVKEKKIQKFQNGDNKKFR